MQSFLKYQNTWTGSSHCRRSRDLNLGSSWLNFKRRVSEATWDTLDHVNSFYHLFVVYQMRSWVGAFPLIQHTARCWSVDRSASSFIQVYRSKWNNSKFNITLWPKHSDTMYFCVSTWCLAWTIHGLDRCPMTTRRVQNWTSLFSRFHSSFQHGHWRLLRTQNHCWVFTLSRWRSLIPKPTERALMWPWPFNVSYKIWILPQTVVSFHI